MTCKKVSFLNEEQCLFYIKKLKDTSVRIKKPVRGYLCEKCLCWHLTSKTNKDDERENAYREDIKKKNELIAKLNSRINELRQKLK